MGPLETHTWPGRCVLPSGWAKRCPWLDAGFRALETQVQSQAGHLGQLPLALFSPGPWRQNACVHFIEPEAVLRRGELGQHLTLVPRALPHHPHALVALCPRAEIRAHRKRWHLATIGSNAGREDWSPVEYFQVTVAAPWGPP